jgi:hypothetical protein
MLKRKADPVYSEPLNVNGLSWRLKVYPVSNKKKTKNTGIYTESMRLSEVVLVN